ncbi:MAG: hypothetical protein LBT40_05275 [Deltaproteobacteria bacterium]|jgi:hypothetical protein|nr:hypothetical protein [Deltaproteobacteria bacterium]
MNPVSTPRNLPAQPRPAQARQAPSTRDSSLREELLGEIFGKRRQERPRTETQPEAALRSVPPSYGKGYYVDLYV